MTARTSRKAAGVEFSALVQPRLFNRQQLSRALVLRAPGRESQEKLLLLLRVAANSNKSAHARKKERIIMGHEPARRLSQEIQQKKTRGSSRVRSGGVRNLTDRAGLGQDLFKISRVGPGHPKVIRTARSNTSREKPRKKHTKTYTNAKHTGAVEEKRPEKRT